MYEVQEYRRSFACNNYAGVFHLTVDKPKSFSFLAGRAKEKKGRQRIPGTGFKPRAVGGKVGAKNVFHPLLSSTYDFQQLLA